MMSNIKSLRETVEFLRLMLDEANNKDLHGVANMLAQCIDQIEPQLKPSLKLVVDNSKRGE